MILTCPSRYLLSDMNLSGTKSLNISSIILPFFELHSKFKIFIFALTKTINYDFCSNQIPCHPDCTIPRHHAAHPRTGQQAGHDTPQVHSVTLQTAEYIVLGKKDRAKYGKSFLGYTGMQVHCYIGQKLKPKELRRILKKIRNYQYENIVFDGFVTDQVRMDHSFHAGVLPGLIAGEYPSFTLRRSSK